MGKIWATAVGIRVKCPLNLFFVLVALYCILTLFQIAAISPADINFEESLSTLRYGQLMCRVSLHSQIWSVHVQSLSPLSDMVSSYEESLSTLRYGQFM